MSLPPPGAAGRRGGVLVHVDGVSVFLPASMAVKVAEKPKVARLAGAPPEVLGIALFEGALIPIVSLSAHLTTTESVARLSSSSSSAACRAMVVCQHEGERLGLMGLEVVASGAFASSGDDAGVITPDGACARTFDIGDLYARLRGARSGLGVPSTASPPRPPVAPEAT